jgi:hypothetical protein
MSAREKAEDLLIFYFRRAWEEAGLRWDSDNSSEIRQIVDHLAAAAAEEPSLAEILPGALAEIEAIGRNPEQPA